MSGFSIENCIRYKFSDLPDAIDFWLIQSFIGLVVHWSDHSTNQWLPARSSERFRFSAAGAHAGWWSNLRVQSKDSHLSRVLSISYIQTYTQTDTETQSQLLWLCISHIWIQGILAFTHCTEPVHSCHWVYGALRIVQVIPQWLSRTKYSIVQTGPAVQIAVHLVMFTKLL